MRYLIYLRRSFQRRFFRHLALFLILISAMAMPLIVSIYRASDLQGTKEEILENTMGSDFLIRNANEEDLPFFMDISGLEASYNDGIILLKDISGEEVLSDDAFEHYSEQIQDRMVQSGNEHLSATCVSYYGDDESLYHASGQILTISWLITAVALAVFLSSYGNHLRLFQPEIGVLRSIGASRGQIVLLFLSEYIVIFLSASILAVAFSALIMKLLFVFYLEIRHVEGLASVVFHMNISEMLQYLVAFFVIGSITVCISVFRFFRQNVRILVQENNLTGHRCRYKRKIKDRGNAVQTVRSLYLQRLSRVPKSCGILAVPVLLIVLFAVNYLAINLKAVNTPPETDIRINCYDSYNGLELLSPTERQAISQMDGVLEYKESSGGSMTDFLIADERMEEGNHYDWIGTPCSATSVHCYSSFDPDSGLELKKHEVIVTANHAILSYKAGDMIQLQPGTFIVHEDGTISFKEPIQLKVVGTEDIEWTDKYVDLFLSDDLYEELMADLPINQISIRLNDPSEAKDFAMMLSEEYPLIKDEIHEYQSAYNAIQKAAPGTVIMFTILFGLMLFFFLAVQIIRMVEDLKEQESIRAILRAVGASDHVLYKAHLSRMAIIALVSIICAVALTYGLLFLFFNRTGYHLVFTFKVISIQILILLCSMLTYFIPVFMLFRKKHLKEAPHE